MIQRKMVAMGEKRLLQVDVYPIFIGNYRYHIEMETFFISSLHIAN